MQHIKIYKWSKTMVFLIVFVLFNFTNSNSQNMNNVTEEYMENNLYQRGYKVERLTHILSEKNVEYFRRDLKVIAIHDLGNNKPMVLNFTQLKKELFPILEKEGVRDFRLFNYYKDNYLSSYKSMHNVRYGEKEGAIMTLGFVKSSAVINDGFQPVAVPQNFAPYISLGSKYMTPEEHMERRSYFGGTKEEYQIFRKSESEKTEWISKTLSEEIAMREEERKKIAVDNVEYLEDKKIAGLEIARKNEVIKQEKQRIEALRKEFAAKTNTEFLSDDMWGDVYTAKSGHLASIFDGDFEEALKDVNKNAIFFQSYVVYYSKFCREGLPSNFQEIEIKSTTKNGYGVVKKEETETVYIDPRFIKKYKEYWYNSPAASMIFMDVITGNRRVQRWMDNFDVFIKMVDCNSKEAKQFGENIFRLVHNQKSLQDEKAELLGITRGY